MTDKWEPTPIEENSTYHLCPRCNQRTETLYTIDDEFGECQSAERCTHCRYIVDFDADEIKAVSY